MKSIRLITLTIALSLTILGCEMEESPKFDFTTFEKYCEKYFAENKNYKNHSKTITHRTKEFIAMNEGTKEFSRKIPYKIFPIYALGVDGVAYYEVWFTRDGKNPEGWVIFSVTDKDYPLLNFSHAGIPYSKRVTDQAKKKGVTVNSDVRAYRFGVSYYSLEDIGGNKIAEFGKMPHFLPKDIDVSNGGKGDSKTKTVSEKAKEDTIELRENVHYNTINNYADLKKYFAESYFTKRRANVSREMLQRIFPQDKRGEAYHYMKSSGQYIYRWVSGTQALYTQIPANMSFNHTGCWSGCNNNAWSSLYAWWDLNQGKDDLIPTTGTGEDSPTVRNNKSRRDVVDPVQMWFRGTCGTYCSGGGGWTKWKHSWKGYKWADNLGYGWSYWYQWCNTAGCDVDLANILVDSIGNNYRPAQIGANSHFYVGTGLAQWSTNTDWTWVYAYPGWAENHNDDVWIYWRDLNASTKTFVY